VIEYGPASIRHTEAIARLHAYSWQMQYRGIFNDNYLDYDVVQDRLTVWKRRFENPSKDQFIVLAIDQDLLCGFGCAYLNHDQQYGTLIDNLHVHPDWQRKGILLKCTCGYYKKTSRPGNSMKVWEAYQ